MTSTTPHIGMGLFSLGSTGLGISLVNVTGPFVSGISGGGLAVLVQPHTSGTLDKLWVHVGALFGTFATTTDTIIQAQIRQGFSPYALIASVNVPVGSTTGWKSVVPSSPISLTGGVPYTIWFVDSDSTASNYARVSTLSCNTGFPGDIYTVVNGSLGSRSFSTAGSCAFKIGTSMYGPPPYTATLSTTFGTQQRGVKFTSPYDMRYVGMMTSSIIFANTVLYVFADGVGPNGSPLWSFTVPSVSSIYSGMMFSDPYLLRGGQRYILTWRPVSNSTPTWLTASGLDSDLRQLLPLEPTFKGIEQSGSSWVENDYFPTNSFTPALFDIATSGGGWGMRSGSERRIG